MDPLARFLAGRTVRRAIALGAFLGLLLLFRHLIPLLVFFIAFSRSLGAAADAITRRTRIAQKWVVLGLVLALLGTLGGAIAFGVGRGIHAVVLLRQTLPEKIALVKETPLYQQLQDHLQDTDSYLDSAKDYATHVVGYLTAFGKILLHAVVGLILAVIYLLEKEELLNWARTIDPRSLIGTLKRWLGHLADAVALTIQLQLIVAGCNAVFTLPILLALGIPHAGPLFLMIFASSLVPVVGNIISGIVLSLLAYHSRGLVGVGVFVALTFVLHKVESYYLNPRLTARHVRLPGFVLILSLIAWEHLLGIAGLFVSFPFLFVATRIRNELRDEEKDLGAESSKAA
jgi:predicted PurR-regulated permease PerM